MNVVRQRVLNILAGIVFAILGLACYGVAAYLVKVPPDPVMGPDSLKLETAACTKLLERLGFKVSVFPTELRVAKQNALDDAKETMADASIGISSCGMPITRFCMGQGCQPPAVPNGIFFALSTQLPGTESSQ